MNINHNPKFCPIENTLKIIGGKWKAILLWYIAEAPKRYGELKKLVPGISEKMLIQSLRAIETDGLINREVFNEIPPRVEYSVTKRGETLMPILKTMYAWGAKSE